MRTLVRRQSPQAPAPDDGGLYFASAKEHIDFIRSGSMHLDAALGGGWPLGRISNVIGDNSTGKTLLALEAIANFFMQYGEEGGEAWYDEAESAFDHPYAAALGIPIGRVTFKDDAQRTDDTIEKMQKRISKIVDARRKAKSQLPGLYILDTLDGMSDDAERAHAAKINSAKEGTKVTGSYGMQKAKALSQFFRLMHDDIEQTRVHFMVVSQIRHNADAGPYAKKWTRSGGKGLDFYASQIAWLAVTDKLEKTINKYTLKTGVHVQADIQKNKVSVPYRKAEFDIRFGYGIEDESSARDWLAKVGAPASPNMGPGELRTVFMQKWYEVEKAFLPTRRKYGG